MTEAVIDINQLIQAETVLVSSSAAAELEVWNTKHTGRRVK